MKKACSPGADTRGIPTWTGSRSPWLGRRGVTTGRKGCVVGIHYALFRGSSLHKLGDVHDGISWRDHQKTIKKNGIVRRVQTLRNLLDKSTRLIPQFPNSRRWSDGRISNSLVACSAKGTHGPPVRRSA